MGTPLADTRNENDIVDPLPNVRSLVRGRCAALSTDDVIDESGSVW